MFGKWAFDELTVGQTMLLRFAFASLGFVAVVWHESRSRSVRVKRADVPFILVAALIGVPVQFLVQFEGLHRTTVTHASLMVGTLPAMLAVAAALFAHERVGRIGWATVVVSTVGAGLVAFGGGAQDAADGATLAGDLLVIASLVAAVAWVLMSKRLMERGYSPVMASALIMLIGTVMLAAWVLATEPVPPLASLSLRTVLSVVALGLIATTTTTLLWNWGLSHVPASRAGVFTNLEPAVGAVLGVALFHDAFGALSIAGGILIIAAAVAASLRGAH